jgi:UDP-glucose:glycoprotein glucosyltransferase
MIYQPFEQRLIIASFAPVITTILLATNPGMENITIHNVVYDDAKNVTTVNIFSFASGRLDERLLKTMMLSARRHSKHPVKLWIEKTFLSPQFKAALPILSAKYHFGYQLVNYNWPLWVYPQFEKQRIMWANKVLFLDVLFPLEVDRIVYVSAYQIVRTDLIELVQMDFGNAPYAFAPFCETREETEEFRFWKRGYWEIVLRPLGMNFYSSEFFAVDLRKFRRLAAGDSLRLHYHTLSKHADSLSSLDQDLLNFAQRIDSRQVPIFPLDVDWVWCETWCSDKSFAKAKIISLCDHPVTKISKLSTARTLIKEWPQLDEAGNISTGPDEYKMFFFP